MKRAQPEEDRQSTAVRLATSEIAERSWSLTQHYLLSNAVATDPDGSPTVAHVDTTSEPGSFRVYFPVFDQPYFIVVFIRPEAAGLLEVSWIYWEAETRAWLVLTSETVLPDTITQTVELTPTATHMRDPSAKVRHLRRVNTWSFEVQPGIPGSIESKVAALLDAVEPRAEAIASLGQTCGIHLNLLYRAWTGNGHLGGLNLGPHELGIIGSMGATLDFDVYASGPWLTSNDDRDRRDADGQIVPSPPEQGV